MDTSRWRSWLQNRLQIADHTVQQFGETGLFDAELLLCCAISTVAAYVWPGRGIDRGRYTELLFSFAKVSPPPSKISVPTLATELEKQGALVEARIVTERFFPASHALVLTHADVDQDEATVSSLVPAVTKTDLRRCSYAGIIYEDLRSGLVHEYLLNERLSGFSFSSVRDVPSYFNLLLVPGEKSRRILHLPYAFIRELVESTCLSVFDHWDRASKWDSARPAMWWIDGR